MDPDSDGDQARDPYIKQDDAMNDLGDEPFVNVDQMEPLSLWMVYQNGFFWDKE
jgi:hypothetical protein